MLSLYIALAIFGLGVTVVDLFGLLGHHDSGGHATGHGTGHDSGQDSGGDASDDGGHEGGHDGGGNAGTDAGGHAAHEAGEDGVAHVHGDVTHHTGDRSSSVLGVGDAKARAVGRLVMVLRTAVYLSLGAGLTGVVAVASGIGSLPSLLWSAAGGALTAVVSRLVRRVARRDLDSSLGAADFIMSEAEIVIGLEPGKLGKARVKRFGLDRDLYVRSRESGAAIAAGTRVRIVDYDDECYFVEVM